MPALHQLQTNNRTFVGRHWTEHTVLRRYLSTDEGLSILSFGCSTGEELVTLATLFPGARLFGCDIDWHNLTSARALAGRSATVFESRDEEIVRHGPYDVIVCNSVLLSHTTVVGGRARGIDPSRWLDVLSLLDSALKPGGILQIINSNIPFRFHPVAANYEPLRSPLILGPGFVDQFDLQGRHLCTGVAGVGWSALLNRHLGEEGWRELVPEDFHDVHFWKRGGVRRPSVIDDEVVPSLSHGGTLATGTMSYRSEIPPDARPSTHMEIDIAWTATGVDTIQVRRNARRIWFDGSVAFTSDTTLDIAAASATAFIESAIGRRSTRLAMDASIAPTVVRAPAF